MHLHVHTEYSMLDGAARLKELFAEAARLGMPALAMTDHGNMFGAYDFYKQATAAGVKPIIGIEAYLTPGTARRDRTRVRWADGGENDVSGGGAYTHMTMLAADADGPAQPVPAGQSRASLEGYFYKPRIDRELLAEYAQGHHRHHRLPVRRGADLAAARRLRARRCAVGRRVPGHLRPGQLLPGADGPRPRHRDPGPRRTCCGCGKRAGAPPVATNDLHYTYEARRRRARGAAVRAVRHDAWPTRTGSGSTRATTTSSRAERDARAVGRRGARRLRQHAADRRAGRRLQGRVRRAAT